MKNAELWKETKFTLTAKGLTPSADAAELGVGSRFVATIQAGLYESLIRDYARGDLLDVGCGNAPLYMLYGPLSTSVTLVDWASTLHPNAFLDHACDINEGIPLPDSSFDTILATDVIEHLHNPSRFFGESARLLRAGGKLIVTVPFLYWIHEEPHDYYRYTEFGLRRFCEGSGLAVDRLEPYGGAAEAIIDIVAKHLSGSRVLSRLHLALGSGFCRSPLASLIRRKSASRFPLGYALVAHKRH